jgi:hypothetical protein
VLFCAVLPDFWKKNYFFGRFLGFAFCPSGKSDMEHSKEDTDRVKIELLVEKLLLNC